MDYRGDIITLPAEKGDPRNLTNSTGAHEKYPSWTLDGKSVAWFSDASGEYKMQIQSQDGKGEVKSYKLPGTGFYAYAKWSPDSKKISFTDNGRNLYILDIESGAVKKVDSDELYAPGQFRQMFGDWSSDSRWILYTKMAKTYFKVVYLYSLDQQKSFPVTDGMCDASDPVFDPNGENIYFFASTDAGPVVNWFDLSNQDMKMTNSIWLAMLRKDIVSPFIKESDEEKVIKEAKDSVKQADKNTKDVKSTKAVAEKPKLLKIDTDGITDRTINLPVRAGDYYELNVGATGEIFYIARISGSSASPMLHKFDLKERKDSEVMEVNGYGISADRKKMFYVKARFMALQERGRSLKWARGS
jgi:tricorn protease